MGWQSDWLYELIFHEVEIVREAATRHDAKNGQPPNTCFVSEYTDADWERAMNQGSVKRSWILKRGEPIAESDTACNLGDDSEVDGVFFDKAFVTFHIATDRKRVVFVYFLGPRYARGRILAVQGQGK
ncbi:MAG TPA: hypothetical protein VHZ24_02235 [Pirellulales bacterium]|jgi:hypothetical protein|nr:hypothetical protein [Pirellulales bacterium]